MKKRVDYSEVGDRIRIERERFEISRERFAELLNLSPFFRYSISRCEIMVIKIFIYI